MDTSNLIVLGAIAVVMVLVGYPTVRDTIFEARARREGVSTDATIIRKRMNPSRVGAYCSLEYTYLDYERLEIVKRTAYDVVDEGDQIAIVYLKSNPEDARIVDARVKG